MVRRVEEAEHRGRRQTAADLRTFPSPPLVVEQELYRTHYRGTHSYTSLTQSHLFTQALSYVSALYPHTFIV